MKRWVKRKDHINFRKSSTVDTETSEDRGSNDVLVDHHEEGRRLVKQGCLKVLTQRESLANKSPEQQLHHPVSGEKKVVVRFDSIEFRHYVRILSDNPSTSSGPPIGIGWEFIPEDTIRIALDLYESGCDDGLRRRSGRELVLPRDLREKMLREVGYSRSDIANAIRGVQKVKVSRNISFQNRKYDPIVERIEAAKFRIRRLLI